jgi:hypothetical protein
VKVELVGGRGVKRRIGEQECVKTKRMAEMVWKRKI